MSVSDNAGLSLRIAVVGSGPSGFYAAEHLLKQDAQTIEVDMFDRLPTPYGLVRGGVAPDHQKIKSVTKKYERVASNPAFRFYGNVEFGTDITMEDMARHYHAVIFAVGAADDRKLGIPGEDLPGSHGATEFVAWYNGHPDYANREFDLSQESVAVIGIGNVAMDVARILASSQEELYKTDIADHALDELAGSSIKTIYVLGRRGPVQAKFTNPEIRELGEMDEANVVIAPEELALDPLSQAVFDLGENKMVTRNMNIMQGYADNPSSDKPRKIVFRFLTSPVEIIGDHEVEAIKIVKNELYEDERGRLRPRATDETEVLPVQLVFRSVGYRGKPLPGVPFHDPWGTIPHENGRVLTQLEGGEQVVGRYIAGWIKRGPSGVIGTNKPCAVETVNALLDDAAAGKIMQPVAASREAVEALLKARDLRYVTFQDWLIIDSLEVGRGDEVDRPRRKFTDIDEMLDALDDYKDLVAATEEDLETV